MDKPGRAKLTDKQITAALEEIEIRFDAKRAVPFGSQFEVMIDDKRVGLIPATDQVESRKFETVLSVDQEMIQLVFIDPYLNRIPVVTHLMTHDDEGYEEPYYTPYGDRAGNAYYFCVRCAEENKTAKEIDDWKYFLTIEAVPKELIPQPEPPGIK